jgi:hypothetical protein
VGAKSEALKDWMEANVVEEKKAGDSQENCGERLLER